MPQNKKSEKGEGRRNRGKKTGADVGFSRGKRVTEKRWPLRKEAIRARPATQRGANRRKSSGFFLGRGGTKGKGKHKSIESEKKKSG